MIYNQKKEKKFRKLFVWFLGIVILSLAIFIYVRFYYVFGTGVKSGELNYLVYKGVIFKTYEGKLIQSGFRADMPGGLQSNQFEFSVEDEKIAMELMLAGGKMVQLHYKEFFLGSCHGADTPNLSWTVSSQLRRNLLIRFWKKN